MGIGKPKLGCICSHLSHLVASARRSTVTVSNIADHGSKLAFARPSQASGHRWQPRSSILILAILTSRSRVRSASLSTFSSQVSLTSRSPLFGMSTTTHVISGAKLTHACLVYAFNIGFYGLPITNKIGFAGGFAVLGALSVSSLILPAFLIFFGERIRKAQGSPKEHADL